MKVRRVKSQEAGVRRPYPHTDASVHVALFTVRTGPLQGPSVWVRSCLCGSGALGPGEASVMPCSEWPSVLIIVSFLNLQSQRMKWKCPMMVSETGCLQDRLLGWRGWEGGI